MPVRVAQSANAPSPMLVTLAGMVMEVMPESKKAKSPIVVRVVGKVTVERFRQFLNAESPMLVILSERVTVERAVQYIKMSFGRLVKLASAKETDWRWVKQSNAPCPMLVTVLGIVYGSSFAPGY